MIFAEMLPLATSGLMVPSSPFVPPKLGSTHAWRAITMWRRESLSGATLHQETSPVFLEK